MRRQLLSAVLLCTCLPANAQVTWPWSYTGGGTADEAVKQVIARPDGGCFLFGETRSFNGDVTGNHGGSDIWIVSLNRWGEVLWKTCFGGEYDETFFTAKHTGERTVDVWNYSQSSGGDVDCVMEKWGPSAPAYGWSFRMDQAGNLLNQRCERPEEHEKYLSTAGNYAHKGNELWLYSPEGKAVAKKTFSGNIRKVLTTRDGGYALAGCSERDVTSPSADFWVARLDAGGKLLWEQKYDFGSAEEAVDLVETYDGFMVAGNFTTGKLRNKLLRISFTGARLWESSASPWEQNEVTCISAVSGKEFILAGIHHNAADPDAWPDESGQYWAAKVVIE